MFYPRQTSVILLTYKSKVLLRVNDFSFENNMQNVWGMIESLKRTNESFLEAVLRKTKEEMNIRLQNVGFLFQIKHADGVLYFSHGRLTDDNVNSIERKEGQEIQFYSPAELVKLQLSPLTNSFMSGYRNELEKLLIHKSY